jgi:hypothetical protein
MTSKNPQLPMEILEDIYYQSGHRDDTDSSGNIILGSTLRALLQYRITQILKQSKQAFKFGPWI